MKIEFELTKQDYIQFNISQMKYSKSLKKVIAINRFVVPVLYIVIAFASATITDIPLFIWLACFGAVSILWVLFYPDYFKRLVKKRVTKQLGEGKNKGILGKTSLIVDDDGISRVGEHGESKSNWSAVEHIVNTDGYLFIHISPVAAYIVPLRDFSSEEQKNGFIRLIENCSKLECRTI